MSYTIITQPDLIQMSDPESGQGSNSEKIEKSYVQLPEPEKQISESRDELCDQPELESMVKSSDKPTHDSRSELNDQPTLELTESLTEKAGTLAPQADNADQPHPPPDSVVVSTGSWIVYQPMPIPVRMARSRTQGQLDHRTGWMQVMGIYPSRQEAEDKRLVCLAYYNHTIDLKIYQQQTGTDLWLDSVGPPMYMIRQGQQSVERM